MILDKKKIFIIVIIVLLGLSIFFRDRISSILTFRSEPERVVKLPEDKPKEEKLGEALISSSMPVYKGADPAQVLPDPEALKGLDDQQKENLYSRIRTHAGEVKANPDYFAGWLEIGLLKKVIGDLAGARDAWEYASLIRPQNSVSFANLGELYWRYLSDYPRSEQNFHKALENDPKDADTYVSIAELYHYSLRNKVNEAPGVLLDGLKVNPGNDTLTRRLAYLYEQREEYALALEWWEKVLAGDPGNLAVVATIEKLRNR